MVIGCRAAGRADTVVVNEPPCERERGQAASGSLDRLESQSKQTLPPPQRENTLTEVVDLETGDTLSVVKSVIVLLCNVYCFLIHLG